MKASLDTNVMIHLYRANQEHILFDFFKDGVFIYEQIRNIELENHGLDVLEKINYDIGMGKIEIYTKQKLQEQGVLRIFEKNVNDNKCVYNPGDMGEVYAISLAQTIGAYSLVTDDIKQGGPYMSLLQFVDYDVMPLTFADIIILTFLAGEESAVNAIDIFEMINEASNLKWSFKSQLGRFIKRFWRDPYQEIDKEWMIKYCKERGINPKDKLRELQVQIHNE